ncbi:MAG: hypothetical protein ACI93R_001382 [Flavobacteriales bacterium]|jgi:hypothetical protein
MTHAISSASSVLIMRKATDATNNSMSSSAYSLKSKMYLGEEFRVVHL